MASSSPWTTRTGARTWRHTSANSVRPHACSPKVVSASVEGSISWPQRDAVLDRLRRVGFGEHAPEEELEEAVVVELPVVAVVLGPSLGRGERLVEGVHRPLGMGRRERYGRTDRHHAEHAVGAVGRHLDRPQRAARECRRARPARSRWRRAPPACRRRTRGACRPRLRRVGPSGRNPDRRRSPRGGGGRGRRSGASSGGTARSTRSGAARLVGSPSPNVSQCSLTPSRSTKPSASGSIALMAPPSLARQAARSSSAARMTSPTRRRLERIGSWWRSKPTSSSTSAPRNALPMSVAASAGENGPRPPNALGRLRGDLGEQLVPAGRMLAGRGRDLRRWTSRPRSSPAGRGRSPTRGRPPGSRTPARSDARAGRPGAYIAVWRARRRRFSASSRASTMPPFDPKW